MPPPFLDFFLQKRSLLAKLVLKEHKICLKMLEMAILETQIFKNFCGSMPPDPPRKLAPSALVGAPPPLLQILDPPLLLHVICDVGVRCIFVNRTIY